MSIAAKKHERQLLSQVALGDQLAFKEIYTNYFDKIHAFAQYILQSPDQAQEVVQEVMLKLWQMGQALHEIRDLEGFLKTLSKRRAIDHLRRQQLEKRILKDAKSDWAEDHNETEEALQLKETSLLLEAAIQLLPPQQKLVYQLCKQQGLKYEEAATQLAISPGTVHRHMKLALKFLRAHMKAHTDLQIILIILKLL